MGSFRTPSLRELATTAPYRHNGAIATLEEWVEHYGRVPSLAPGDFLGTLDPSLSPIEVTPQEKQELIDFLLSLSSPSMSRWTRQPEEVPGKQE